MYCIVGNFQGIQFSRIGDLYCFIGLTFMDVHTHSHPFAQLVDCLRKQLKMEISHHTDTYYL